MTVSTYSYANSMVEALSLSFRDQMSIFLSFFAEIRHIIRSESEDAKKDIFCIVILSFREMLTDETGKIFRFEITVLVIFRTLRKSLLLSSGKDFFSSLRF